MVQSAGHINQNLDLDKLPTASGAEFNSYANQHENVCLPGTRTDLLHQIAEWAVFPWGKCIFWLNGMAGTGKSTISRTIAKSFQQDKLLAASFFFKRGERDRGTAMKLFSTITRQLAARIPELVPGVREAVNEGLNITEKSLREQFDKLLLQPLLGLGKPTSQIPTLVIVIDALDECENDNDIRVILQLFPQLQKTSAVHIRIFLTSRPELPIRLGFSEIANYDYQDLALHEIPEAVTEQDISLFLNDRFTRIREVRDVPFDWPGYDIIQTLVSMSMPLFISAATVCRFVEAKLDPVECLSDLLQDQAKYATKMDKTYLPILTRLLDSQEDEDPEQLVEYFQRIIGVVILLAVPLSVNALSQFLGVQPRVVSNLLDSFRSVLSIPSDQNLPIRILHLSFRDYLVNSKSTFRVDEQQTHEYISTCCLTTMHRLVKRDICNLLSYGTERTEIDSQSIHQHLPSELQYSCRYWAHHLVKSQDPSAAIHSALPFLRNHLLHWVEAMSLLGCVSDVVGIINLLQTAMHVSSLRKGIINILTNIG